MKNKGNYCKMLNKIVIAGMSRGTAELSGRKPEMQILKNVSFAVIINKKSFQINKFLTFEQELLPVSRLERKCLNGINEMISSKRYSTITFGRELSQTYSITKRKMTPRVGMATVQAFSLFSKNSFFRSFFSRAFS